MTTLLVPGEYFLSPFGASKTGSREALNGPLLANSSSGTDWVRLGADRTAPCAPLDNQMEKRMLLLIVKGGNIFMTEKPGDVVQGTLDMLILKTLALEPMHGYGIAQRIEQMSKGVFRVNAGSLFVALQRLERAGLIRSEWKASENNRRAKYYLLTEPGRKRLSNETREWGRQVAAIARILEAS